MLTCKTRFQPSAAFRNFEFLLGRIKSLDEVSPFSTQPNVAQPDNLDSFGPPITVPPAQRNSRVPMPQSKFRGGPRRTL